MVFSQDLTYDIFNIALYTNSRTKIKLLENCLVDRAQHAILKANMEKRKD